jgi:hypothetical protein
VHSPLIQVATPNLGKTQRFKTIQAAMNPIINKTSDMDFFRSKPLHLALDRIDSGLVCRRKEGLQVYYRLDDPLVEQLCTLVCSTIRSEVERTLVRQRELLQKIGPPR